MKNKLGIVLACISVVGAIFKCIKNDPSSHCSPMLESIDLGDRLR